MRLQSLPWHYGFKRRAFGLLLGYVTEKKKRCVFLIVEGNEEQVQGNDTHTGQFGAKSPYPDNNHSNLIQLKLIQTTDKV